MKKFLFGLVIIVVAFIGCDLDTDPTYYYQTGGISVTAFNLINSSPGITAKQALAYCNQYPVIPDVYKEVKSGYTRTQLENDLNKINVVGFSKTQFLNMLDSYGDVFQMFILLNGDYIYYYVKEE